MTMQLHVMSPEEQEVEHAAVRLANEAKERSRVAASNRLAGYAEPKPGDHLYVSAGRGIKQRCRAGIVFTDHTVTDVLVIGDGDDRPAGLSVTVPGAELILADGSLNVTGRSATDAEASELRKQLADRDSELAKAKAENARLLREARMSARDTGDGAPARLNAQRKARAGLPDGEGFGGKE